MSARDDIVTAANTVEGITAHPYVVPSTDPGTVYVRLDRIDYPNAFGGVGHWNVVLVLPQDLADAERFLERTIPPLREAVSEHLFVTSVTPERLDIPGVGVLPVAFLNGHREY